MTWTSLDWRILTTRAPHDCAGCWRTFSPGVEMRVSVGMFLGDSPNRVYYCLVCDELISKMDMTSDDTFLDENWSMVDNYRKDYAKAEAGLANYIALAHVPTQKEWIALRDMYWDLQMGERWREMERKAS